LNGSTCQFHHMFVLSVLIRGAVTSAVGSAEYAAGGCNYNTCNFIVLCVEPFLLCEGVTDVHITGTLASVKRYFYARRLRYVPSSWSHIKLLVCVQHFKKFYGSVVISMLKILWYLWLGFCLGLIMVMDKRSCSARKEIPFWCVSRFLSSSFSDWDVDPWAS